MCELFHSILFNPSTFDIPLISHSSQITFDYLKGRPMAPKGAQWEAAVAAWKQLTSDPDAKYDKEVVLKGEDIAPTVTWGTSPQVSVEGRKRCGMIDGDTDADLEPF